MSCYVREATEGLLILQPFRHFTYVHSSFSSPSDALPTSQLILQPFRCFTYSTPQLILQPFFRFSCITVSSLTSPGEPPLLVCKNSAREIRYDCLTTRRISSFKSRISLGLFIHRPTNDLRVTQRKKSQGVKSHDSSGHC